MLSAHFAPQAPAATLATQLAVMLLTANTQGYCATPVGSLRRVFAAASGGAQLQRMLGPQVTPPLPSTLQLLSDPLTAERQAAVVAALDMASLPLVALIPIGDLAGAFFKPGGGGPGE